MANPLTHPDGGDESRPNAEYETPITAEMNMYHEALREWRYGPDDDSQPVATAATAAMILKVLRMYAECGADEELEWLTSNFGNLQHAYAVGLLSDLGWDPGDTSRN